MSANELLIIASLVMLVATVIFGRRWWVFLGWTLLALVAIFLWLDRAGRR